MLTVVRHTRGEEEEGRSEMLRATVVGRHAGSAAAMLLTPRCLGDGRRVRARAARLAGAGVTRRGCSAPVSPRWGWCSAPLRWSRRRCSRTPGPRPGSRWPSSGSPSSSGRSATCRTAGWSGCRRSAGRRRRTRSATSDGGRCWSPLLAVGLLGGLAVALANRRDVGAGLVPDARRLGHAHRRCSRARSAWRSGCSAAPSSAGPSGCSCSRRRWARCRGRSTTWPATIPPW